MEEEKSETYCDGALVISSIETYYGENSMILVKD
jgi:hypothetical protein